jgi:hypothetical protein
MTSGTPASQFLLAGNESRVGTVRWWGDVVIGEEAIYIVQGQRARGRSILALFELIADRVLPKEELLGGSYLQIPEAIRNHPAWPVRGSADSRVLIIPRDAVDLIHHQRGKLEVRLIFNGIEIAIDHGRLGGGAVKSFLQATGWPLIWDKKLINISAESAARARKSAKPLRVPYISYTTIACGFALGVLPMLLMLLRNVDKDLISTLYFVGLIGGVSLILFGWVAQRRGF